MISKSIRSYSFPMILLISIALGGFVGYYFGQEAQKLKPLGEIFLNLIFMAIVPLIFFSVSSAIARASQLGKVGKIIFYMTVVFLGTGIIAAAFGLFMVKIFPPAQGVVVQLSQQKVEPINISNQIVAIFTVPDFLQILSHKKILALIIFSILIGFATSTTTEKGKAFVKFLQSGEEVFMRVFSLIMYYAPIGFFAYFAVLVSELGPQIMENYLRVMCIYYVFALIYFVAAFTCYAYFAGKMRGVKLFWKNIILPMTTSLATCSSAASIPANLVAAKQILVPAEIYETTIPLGAIIHKEGSVIGGMLKIAFLFGIFHMDFSGISLGVTAVGVSVLVGTVMGAIPSGGMLGELLILMVYGFPQSALIAIAAISIIIDPLATMINVTGDTVSSMIIARLVDGKSWIKNLKC